MSVEIAVRGKWDRVRYAVCMEVILLAIFVPVVSLVLGHTLGHVSILALALSAFAMTYAVLYNYVFDYFDARLGNVPTERSTKGRICHAILLEVSITLLSLPVVMWWMELGVWQSLSLNISAALFIVCYTYAFTWSYDRIFPIAQPQPQESAEQV